MSFDTVSGIFSGHCLMPVACPDKDVCISRGLPLPHNQFLSKSHHMLKPALHPMTSYATQETIISRQAAALVYAGFSIVR